MKQPLVFCALALAIILMTGCSSSEDTTPPASTETGPILAQSVTGTYSLNGFWLTLCYTTGGNDIRETRVVSDRNMVGLTITYSTNTATCGGGTTGGTVDDTQTLNLAANSTSTFTSLGWSNGSAFGPGQKPALAVDGLTVISDAPAMTLMDLSGTVGGTPDAGKMPVFIDDTEPVTDVIWYRGTGNPPGDCDPLTTQSEQCALSVDEFHQVSGPVLAQSQTGTYSLNGTWKTACYNAAGIDLVETIVVTDRKLTSTSMVYVSTDGSCTGGGANDPAQTFVLDIHAVDNFTSLGWSDGSATVATPTAVDLSPLQATPAVTRMQLAGMVGGVFGAGSMGVFIDDSAPGTNVVWYRSVRNPAGTCDPGTGAEGCLLTVDVFYKL